MIFSDTENYPKYVISFEIPVKSSLMELPHNLSLKNFPIFSSPRIQGQKGPSGTIRSQGPKTGPSWVRVIVFRLTI